MPYTDILKGCFRAAFLLVRTSIVINRRIGIRTYGVPGQQGNESLARPARL
ncbi:MAG: hypothetical protein JWP78_752 [Mucilaginibacter sp.]|nr:hypothetical protein [Mucilaginibacter sp.]